MPNLWSTITSVRISTALNVLLGVWLFWSPWEYGVAHQPDAWNSWIAGSLLAASAFFRSTHPLGTRGFSLLNMAVGVWIAISPWVFGYTFETTRFVNSVCVGLLAVILAGSGAFDADTRDRRGVVRS